MRALHSPKLVDYGFLSCQATDKKSAFATFKTPDVSLDALAVRAEESNQLILVFARIYKLQTKCFHVFSMNHQLVQGPFDCFFCFEQNSRAFWAFSFSPWKHSSPTATFEPPR